ncbi:MAG: YcbK family protein [Methylobacterium sp.]|nr:YcbK family protein [Methylobacterium sp.]
MVPLRDFHLKGRMRSLAAGLVLWLGLLLAAPAAEAQTGIFSIFRMPQQTDIAPQADAEEDAEFATPPLNALPAPALPLPPRRMTMVQNPTAPAPRPPGLEAVSPAPVLPLAASSPANAPAPVQSPVPQFTAPGVPAGPLLAVPDLPLPPRRPGAPAPAPEPPAQQAEAPAEPPPAVDFDSFAERPTMLASLPFPGFRPMGQPPLQQQETTTEELEKEEERTPEPMQVERQTDDVDIACLKPDLMVLVRKAGDRFGATPIITSGQRYRGRLGSYHRRCMAADFYVPGIPRADLARYLRSLPEAGGVGTYCHTKSVHIDIGEPRNWSQCGFRFRFSQRG